MSDTDSPAREEDPRVRLAGERTLLAWVRTGLALMGFGFVVARFGVFLASLNPNAPPRPGSGVSLGLGVGMVLLGVAVNAIAAVEHVAFLRRLDRGEAYRPPRWSLAVTVALLLAAVGVGMAAYLLDMGR